MQQPIRTIAAILAGGTGSRLGGGLPKQFIRIAGRTLIEHTIDIFESHPMIDEIIVVMNAPYIGEMNRLAVENGWEKVRRVIAGGKERYGSSMAAIREYREHPDWKILIHDAARPLVTPGIITEVILALDRYNAVDVVIPATDTIIQADSTGQFLQVIPDRKVLRQVQTPQGFRISTIDKAYREGISRSDFTATDDCGTVARYLPGEPVFLVKGDPSNLKITFPGDLQILESHFSSLG